MAGATLRVEILEGVAYRRSILQYAYDKADWALLTLGSQLPSAWKELRKLLRQRGLMNREKGC